MEQFIFALTISLVAHTRVCCPFCLSIIKKKQPKEETNNIRIEFFCLTNNLLEIEICLSNRQSISLCRDVILQHCCSYLLFFCASTIRCYSFLVAKCYRSVRPQQYFP